MEASDIIFGRNTVREAVKSSRSIDKIIVAEGSTDGSIREILSYARDKKIVVIKKDKKYLDDMCMPFGYNGRTANHQGIMAFVSAFEYCEVEDILDYAKEKGEPPFVLVLDGITDIHNMGAMIRSAECFGAHGIIVSKRGSAPLNTAVFKASSGAAEHVKIAKIANITAGIKKLKDAGLWVAAAVMNGESAHKVDLSGAMAIVIGDEGEGISRLVEENCDYKIKIDLFGEVQSLNASVAAGVLMYEKKRQDMAKVRD